MSIVIDASTQENIEPFKEKSHNFVEMATSKIDEQINRLNACKQIFYETLYFFKHIPKTGTIDECTPSEFFELWSSFATDFRDLWKREMAALNAEL